MQPAVAETAVVRTVALPSPREVDRMSTDELRSSFLLTDLFVPGQLSLVFTDMDRMVVGGAVPNGELVLDAVSRDSGRAFTERRETGIVNIGDPGEVMVGSERYRLDRFDCLYVGRGRKEIRFRQSDAGQPVFYFCSAPAHSDFPDRLAPANAEPMRIGDEAHASVRWIRKQIHPDGIASCQLVMGRTELAPNSVWNTMPAHTHERRCEVYLYVDVDDGMVVHLMGTPDRTRHLLVRDRQAVLSPAWSVHTGCGTNSYTFVWAMAGENQDFGDIDPAEELR